ncbi:MAG: hypothetical protein ACRENU_05825 [Gemmatimonadaceae bacterium]
MSSPQTLDLNQLGDAYDVIGELAAKREGLRVFMGRRRADGTDVLITVLETPSGDEGNALSHLAADANHLCALDHRNLVPVLEGRWLSHDAFAVVHRRVYAPTLDELLTRRDEEFAFPRIALILQQLNGLLEWARLQKVVHRGLDLDTVHVELGSDQVLASFAVRPLPRTDMPGAADDARMIATLARAMLTRSAMDPERDSLPLTEVRPGLPTAVSEQTEALLAAPNEAGASPDVKGYIASIAMADAIRHGETACEESKQRVLEEERAAREEIDARRRECEEQAVARERAFRQERAAFLKQKESIERALAREKESIQRALAEEKAALDKATPAVVVGPGRFSRWTGVVRDRFTWRPHWSVPAGATAVALLIALVVFARGHDEPSARTVAAREAKPNRRVQESAAGTVVRHAPAVRQAPAMQTPTVPPDLVTGVATRAATEPPPARRRSEPRRDDEYLNRPRSQQVQPYSPPTFESPPTQYVPPVQAPPPVTTPTAPPSADTFRRPDPVPSRPDSVAPRPPIRINIDSLLRNRRDTLRRPDTIPPGGR